MPEGQLHLKCAALGVSLHKEDISDIFEKYGAVRNIFVARDPSGFGFVVYEEEKDAEAALKDLGSLEVKGHKIVVNWSTQKSKKKPREQHERKRGDWQCPTCRFDNFARRETCHRCSAPKPAGLGYEGDYGRRPARSRSRSRGRERGYYDDRRRRSRSRDRGRAPIYNDRRYARPRSPDPRHYHRRSPDPRSYHRRSPEPRRYGRSPPRFGRSPPPARGPSPARNSLHAPARPRSRSK